MNTLWWGTKIVIGFISLIFFVIGVDVLIGSYKLVNPLEFVMYFFSSSLLIMVSAIGLYYSFVQIYNFFRRND